MKNLLYWSAKQSLRCHDKRSQMQGRIWKIRINGKSHKYVLYQHLKEEEFEEKANELRLTSLSETIH